MTPVSNFVSMYRDDDRERLYCERFTGTSASCVVPVWKKEEQNHTGCGESLVWFCFFVSRKQKSS